MFNFLKRANQEIIPTIDEIEELSRKCELLNTRIKELENTLKEYNQTQNENLRNPIKRQIKDIKSILSEEMEFIDKASTPRALHHTFEFDNETKLRIKNLSNEILTEFDEFFYELLLKYKDNEHRVLIIFSEIAHFNCNYNKLTEFKNFLGLKNLNPIYSISFQNTIPALITLKLQQLVSKYLNEQQKGKWQNQQIEQFILNNKQFFSLTQRQYESKLNRTDQCPKDDFNDN